MLVSEQYIDSTMRGATIIKVTNVKCLPTNCYWKNSTSKVRNINMSDTDEIDRFY